MKIAIVGAGSLGIVVGARLAPHNPGLVMIDADPANVAALNAHGARVTGSMTLSVPVSAIEPAQMQGTYDLVLLLTKQTYNNVALAQLAPHLGEESVVCTLQNGIPEDSVAAIIGAGRTVGGTVGFGATYMGPGASQLTSTVEAVERHAFEIGEIDGPITSRLRTIAEILSAVGHCELVDDLMAIRWSKLLMNATFSGVSTALACSFGDVLESPEAMEFLARVADELVRVAHASGHHLAPMQGEDMDSLLLAKGETLADKMRLYRRVWSRHALLRASMLQDLEKRRKTEIDAINGYVVERGREAKIATPFNQLIVDLIRAAEARQSLPDRSHSAAAMRALIAAQASSTG
ncbi:ketopantoate reductase family protein [Hephaestia mangrovi]|uniref:ketopantoate reductase family protein n=1 Tax=Hephaestia mangrovi TaxID=2873268 RepID=UPI001CA66270|nr:2-dehydropantoate 2-reductase [Hephaestia mangrovi]MBY8829907.1 2-dehydropantoate 2-reductase [Hephaestia mangrovi]